MYSRAIAILSAAMLGTACDAPSVRQSQDQQSRNGPNMREIDVEKRGEAVMPFDLYRTLHRFSASMNGGTQTVISKDRDPVQARLIRNHLRSEQARFARGDFSSPATIHGSEMPGLSELAGASGMLSVRYEEVADGAQLIFETADPTVVVAVHRWFEAQVKDHGRHANR